MKRREPDPAAGIPAGLLAFSPTGGDLDVEFAAWGAVRKAWALAHGWPDGTASRLREQRAVRRTAHGMPLHPRRLLP
ncbi:MAG: hypothetical protein NVS3B18_08000 [Candidatus Dormibacteria bacterium]